MKFHSTRDPHSAVDLDQAISAGLAPDGGLYVPASLPRFDTADFDGADDIAQIAQRLLAPFFAGSQLAGELEAICAETFGFDIPLVALGDGRSQVLELFHGPTAAFKDVGARFLAACLQRLHGRSERPLTILVATSGDTGAAVAAAFHRRPGLRVVVLYPDGRVSPRQAHQLGCLGDNVHSFRVAGSFDDCQRLVKQALSDAELKASVPLSSANSISLGRLLPQMSYYADAALCHWRRSGQPLGFVIPTGNLGNALAAILVRQLGLPVGRIVLATNANRVLPDYFAGHAYTPQASIATLANAMDVGSPSNFERLRWLIPDADELRSALAAASIDDERIRATIRSADQRFGRAICPHTACALAVLDDLTGAGSTEDWAIVATADAAKFETIVEPLLGRPLPVPPALAALLARPARAEPLANEAAALYRVLRGLD